MKSYNYPYKKNWVAYYRPDVSSPIGDYLNAVYFLTDFESRTIPEKYARMIQYSDCMIDTSSKIHIDGTMPIDDDNIDSIPDEIKKFINFIEDKTNMPPKGYEYYYAKSKRYKIIDSIASMDSLFMPLMKKAVDLAVSNNLYHDYLDYCSAKYYSKEKALILKRRQQIYGHCSHDENPRIYAIEVALLSAETNNWSIFLRAHLDILNDNFSRTSDASWVQQYRKTYIKELEILGINTTDLLLGICFQIENPSRNHYFGSVNRIGRALAEASNKDEIEDKILSIIKDKQLDDNNRLIFYFLFDNYNHNLSDKDRFDLNQKKVGKAIETLPEYISRRLKSNNFQFEYTLGKEYKKLEKYFTFQESFVGYFGYDDWKDKSWKSILRTKTDTNNIFINAKCYYYDKPKGVEPLIKIKDELLLKTKSIKFLMDSLKTNHSDKILINYYEGEIFSEEEINKFIKFCPDSIKSKLPFDLKNTIYFTYHTRWEHFDWLIFSNGKLMLWKYCCRPYPLLRYSEEQLRIGDYGDGIPCYKYFDFDGNLMP